MTSRGIERSGNDLVNHSTMNIRQTKITTAVAVGEVFVVDSHEVKNRRVQIMRVRSIVHRGEAHHGDRPQSAPAGKL